MENRMEKSAGTALIASTFLMIVTMVLHPAGGNFAHLIRIIPVIIITHSLALISIPAILYGFRGLYKLLERELILSTFAFICAATGLFAVLCAAAVNGLALPLFLLNYKEAGQPVIDSLQPILKYSSSLNHAFDFIFITAICLAIMLWSVAIIRTKLLPGWIGYYGLLLGVFAILLLFAGFVLVDLHGFRLFIFGIATWIIVVGIYLRARK